MKLSQSSKPISSPGRTDPFPPPLMSFLRTDTGSRSRTGRYRSSPIFPRKKTVANIIETQEPSSPKVTCMGQVRSSKSSGKTKVRCRWIQTVVSFESRRCRSLWKKWGSFFRRKESKFESRNEIEEEEDDDEEQENEERRDRVFVASVSSPPKNALILTRCRSAPHRSSSSIARFWSSAMKSEEEEEEQEEEEKKENGKGNNISQKESDNLGLVEKVEIKDGKEEKKLRDSLRPLILTRCKSEPAKIGEKALSRS